MSINRLYVNFADRDAAGRVRVHDIFQPMAALPSAELIPGQPVLLDDERGHTALGHLVFDEEAEAWLAQPHDEPESVSR